MNTTAKIQKSIQKFKKIFCNNGIPAVAREQSNNGTVSEPVELSLPLRTNKVTTASLPLRTGASKNFISNMIFHPQ